VSVAGAGEVRLKQHSHVMRQCRCGMALHARGDEALVKRRPWRRDRTGPEGAHERCLSAKGSERTSTEHVLHVPRERCVAVLRRGGRRVSS
jgi:hypothetical protein